MTTDTTPLTVAQQSEVDGYLQDWIDIQLAILGGEHLDCIRTFKHQGRDEEWHEASEHDHHTIGCLEASEDSEVIAQAAHRVQRWLLGDREKNRLERLADLEADTVPRTPTGLLREAGQIINDAMPRPAIGDDDQDPQPLRSARRGNLRSLTN